MTKQWTHTELCKKAVSWLKRSHCGGGLGCSVALSEIPSSSKGGEIVDAIGLKVTAKIETIVVEVKVSRSDYWADQRKPFRVNPSAGMGNYRYYLCPEGLIGVMDLPPKWGLIYVGARGKLTVVCGHTMERERDWYFESNRDSELGMASMLLAKAGDFEYLNSVTRLNRRLQNENIQLKKKIEILEAPIRHQELLCCLNELATQQPLRDSQ